MIRLVALPEKDKQPIANDLPQISVFHSLEKKQSKYHKHDCTKET